MKAFDVLCNAINAMHVKYKFLILKNSLVSLMKRIKLLRIRNLAVYKMDN
jgi:hypothetical protein